jgi:hypothetical protein
MMKKARLYAWILALGLGLAGRAAGAPDDFVRDVRALTRHAHRQAGREQGSRAAAAHVEQRLRELGLQEIYTQEFPVVQVRMTECVLEADGARIPVYAARPNLLQAVTTPLEGIAGATLYVGDGRIENYGAQSPEGKIVVVDQRCQGRWMTAFAFGAKAVLFVGDPAGDLPGSTLYSHAPANLPRFYMERQEAERLDLLQRSRDIRLFASAQWETLRGRNVIGVLRGTQPIFDDSLIKEREAVVLAVPLDTYGDVPDLAPGARDAANVAALLHLAEKLTARPPRRDVVFAFLDGQAQNHLGARHFYGALYRKIGNRWLAANKLSNQDRIDHMVEEEDAIRRLQEIFGTGDVLDPALAAREEHGDALRFFSSEAARLGGEVMDRLGPLRMELNDLYVMERKLREEAKDASTDLSPAALGEIERLGVQQREIQEILKELEVEDLAWNSILRIVHDRASPADPAVVKRSSRRLIAHPENPDMEARKRVRFEEMLPRFYRETHEQALKLTERRLQELDVQKREAQQTLAIEKALGQDTNSVVLHVALNFGDARARWCFVHGDDTDPELDEDLEGLYSDLYRAVREVNDEFAQPLSGFDTRSVKGDLPSRLFAPAKFVDSGVVARMFGLYNVSVMTLMDPLSRQGQPADTPERLQIETFFAQVEEFSRLLAPLCDHARLSQTYQTHHSVFYPEARWARQTRTGIGVHQSDLGDPMRRASVDGAVVAAVPAASPTAVWAGSAIPGFVRHVLMRSQSDGLIEAPPLSSLRNWYPLAATMDGHYSDETEATRGLIRGITPQSGMGATLQGARRVSLFRAKPQTIVGNGYHRRTDTVAMGDTSTAALRSDRHLVCESGNLLVLFAPRESDGFKLFNPYGVVLLNNEPNADDYQGAGVPLDDPFRFRVTGETTATDLQHLNQYRLDLLRENQIGEESLEILHGRAQDLLEDARNLEKTGDSPLMAREGLVQASGAYSRRMYAPLVGVIQDLVRAVVFLLLLTIPFAYAVERLLIGTPHIYRRIGWFAIFFLITFLVLYMVNPAFKLAATPVIIFLAFTIILLSAMVITIMLKKLDYEMKKLQGRTVSAHTVDVSRMSTMSAAINMGISTMRRRPLRTLLTSITVILLTFTILTFASFSAMWGSRRSYVAPMHDGNDRIMIRNPLWQPLPVELLDTMRGLLHGRGSAGERYWLAPLPSDVALSEKDFRSLNVYLTDETAEQAVLMSAVLGLDPEDVRRQESLRQAFAEGARPELLNSNGIFLPGSVAGMLNLKDEDVGKATLLFKGQSFVYGGRLRNEFAQLAMLDGSSVLPVDYKASIGRKEGVVVQPLSADEENADTASFVTFGLDSTVVVAADMARRLGGSLRALSFYPQEGQNAEAIGRDLAVVTALPVYVGAQGAVYRLFFTTLLEAQGFRDLIIPILLGGLIIFATMLGSVADREREIYAFSSLGLAPAHVAMLFFAEASVYAVVGGMGGYLVGQVAAKGLAVLGSLGYFAAPAMNFSSMNAVVTILIVMGIVLLSTIYPAFKAARSANPGIQRAWKLPAPQGDIFDIRFPFTVSEYDLTGVVSYLKEYFDGHADASIGSFAVSECDIIRQKENDMLGFRATLALAPFDLGIEQTFVLLSQPSEVEGIDEVRVLVRRLSGTYGDWQRANRVFIDDMRKQFLIWRTLDEQVSEQYRETTLAGWDRFAALGRGDILADYGVAEA